MSHFAFVSSPFGNFAVQATDLNNNYRATESYRLTPLGSLEEVPLRAEGWLDQTVLEAEALKQLTARGLGKHPFLTPQCSYTINNSVYTTELTAETVRDHDGGTFSAVSTNRFDADLTASASKKLAAWWDTVKDSVLTEEFHAYTALGREEYAHERAARNLAEADKAVEVAAGDLSTANAALEAARARVAAL